MRISPAVWLLLLLVLLLTMPQAQAAKQDPQYSLTGLTIVHSQADYIPLHQTATFGWHVYNSTNFWMDNTSTTCGIHIVDGLGQHHDETVLYGGGDRGWYTNFAKSNLTKVAGIYGYIITCNNTEAGFFAGQIDVSEVSELQRELPSSVAIALGVFFMFVVFMAGYFTIQRHPLSYLFVMLAFLVADVMVFIGWRTLQFNGSPLASVIYAVYLGLLVITFVMAIVTMLDLTRLVIQMTKKKEAAANLTRFGYV